MQDAAGQPLGAYGGFSNFANADVQAYNLAIAEEAARAGVDEILWDYVRRPEGPMSSMVFPGLQGSVADAIGGFLGKGQAMLRPLKVLQGASVFGIAATRPDQVGQDVPTIARHTDYIAPMLYPSHWNRRRVRRGRSQPPALRHHQGVAGRLRGRGGADGPDAGAVAAGLRRRRAATATPRCRRRSRRPRSSASQSWLLWNPNTQYTAAALPPLAA